MRITIGIDPGVHFSGVAYAEDGVIKSGENTPNDELFRWLVRPWSRSVDGVSIVTVGCEFPQTYGGRAAGSSDANVLLALARVVGRIEQLASQFIFVAPYPAQWKGQCPKDVMCRRCWSRLSIEERAACEVTAQSRARLDAGGKVPDSATHILDAAGIVLWLEKRLK